MCLFWQIILRRTTLWWQKGAILFLMRDQNIHWGNINLCVLQQMIVRMFQNVATTEAFSSPQEVKQKEENVTKYQLSTSQNQKMSTQYYQIKIYFHNSYSNLYQLVFFQFKKTLSSSWDIETADLNKMSIARMITPKRTNFVFGEAILVSFLTEIQRAPKIYTGINLCVS